MSKQNRRQYFRIDDILAMHDQRMSKGEFELQKKHPGVRSRQHAMIQDIVGKEIVSENLKGSVNNGLATALETIDSKLNYLIGVNMINDASRHNLKERPINLSVTGASFRTTQQYKKGDYASLTMMLPSFPPSIFELIAQVTWVQTEKHHTQHIGVRFSYRCNEEEGSIGRYVFQRHRESIRLKAKESEDLT